MTGTPVNPAAALHAVLLAVLESGADTVNSGWKKVLGVQLGSEEFARRHGEIVGLFNDLLERLLTLPAEEPDRDYYLSMTGTWYKAIVYPGNWNSTGEPASNIGETMTIGHLRGVSNLLRSTSPSTSKLATGGIEQLRKGLENWKSLLGESRLPEELANEIRSQVVHIEWLLDNVQLFGEQSVVKASRSLVGSGMEMMARQPNWAKKLAGAVASLAIVLGGMHQGVDDFTGILNGVDEMRTSIGKMSEGTRELEASAKPNADPQREPIDAEIIDDLP